jgi:hypothetical protein
VNVKISIRMLAVCASLASVAHASAPELAARQLLSRTRSVDEFVNETQLLPSVVPNRKALEPILILERIMRKLGDWPGKAEVIFEYAELNWDAGTPERLELAAWVLSSVIRDYPTYARRDEVLLCAAFLAAQRGKRADTRAFLEQLVREHPTSKLALEVAPLVRPR